MPRLLSTEEIKDARNRVHPEFHDDSCEMCALFSTMSGMVMLLDMKADVDDEPRDEKGRWTTGGGGGGNVYSAPVVPLDPTIIRSDPDYQMSQAIEPAAMSQFISDHPESKGSEWAVQKTLDLNNNSQIAGSAKAMVSRDISARLDPKYDSLLTGGPRIGVGEVWAPDTPPVDQLLGHDSVWSRSSDGEMTYIGAEDSKYGKEYLNPDGPPTSALGAGDIMRGDDPRIIQSLREEGVSNLVATWAGTSNDSSVRSLAMQDAATKEFGLKGTQPWELKADKNYSGAELKENFAREVKAYGPMYQAFLRAQYDNTQQFFKDNKITEVTAYRGFKFEEPYDTQKTPDEQPKPPKWADPERQDEIDEDNESWTAEVPLRPLSSFSYSETKAQDFSGARYEAQGAVISGTIPVARILSTAVTGLGCLGEREMVVLGGTDSWTVK